MTAAQPRTEHAAPADPVALAAQGLQLCQEGRIDQGLQLITLVVGQTGHPFAYFALGHGLSAAGQLEAAVIAFRASLARLANVAPTHTALGHVLGQLGRDEEALAAYDAALLLVADPALHLAKAQTLRRLGRAAASASAYRAGLLRDPCSAPLRGGLANVLVLLGQPQAALTEARLALAFDPGLASAWCDTGNALRQLGDTAYAVTAYRKAIALRPDFPEAHTNLSAALYFLQDIEGAADAAAIAVAARPGDADALTNLGNAQQALLDYSAAEATYRRVLALRPDAAAHSNLSVVLTATGRLDEALAVQRRALALAPDFTDARYNHAVTLLKNGDYAAGWRYYETRWQLSWSPPRGFPQPQWCGEDPAGRTILLHAEQGLGDTLQMVRYAPLLAARGAQVILEVQKPLVRLCRMLPGVAAVIACGDALPPFDLHCPLFSLPGAFGTELGTIPAAPYLHADPDDHALWASRIGGDPSLRVGLVWRGAARIGGPINRERSIDPQLLAPLSSVPHTSFYNLQLQEGQITAPPEIPGIKLRDLTDGIRDFADTAALVAQLDLVIAVDTSTAHLAAAMGKPVWLLSRHNGCWRWLTGRQDSPWYPTMTVFRQTTPRDWTPVLADVLAALRERARKRVLF